MLVAIASGNGARVDGHFAMTDTFYLYQVKAEGYEYIHMVQINPSNASMPVPTEGSAAEAVHEGRIQCRIEALKECSLLLVAAIGKAAVDKVIEHNIYPMKIDSNETIETVLAKIENMMKENPPLWLQRILARESTELSDSKGY